MSLEGTLKFWGSKVKGTARYALTSGTHVHIGTEESKGLCVSVNGKDQYFSLHLDLGAGLNADSWGVKNFNGVYCPSASPAGRRAILEEVIPVWQEAVTPTMLAKAAVMDAEDVLRMASEKLDEAKAEVARMEKAVGDAERVLIGRKLVEAGK